MRHIALNLLILILAVQTSSVRASEAAVGAGPDLKLVAYGTLKKQANGGGYVLVDKKGQPTYFVSPAANVVLDPHVGRQVEVVGRFEGGQQAKKRLVVETVTPTKTAPPAHFVEVRPASAQETTTTPIPRSAVSPPPATAPVVRSAPRIVEQLPADGPLLLEPGAAAPLNEEPNWSAGNPWHVAPCGPPEYVWLHYENLVWWNKGMTLPALVTTNNPAGGVLRSDAGVLGVDSTQVLVGGEDWFNDYRWGGRVQMGGWLGPRRWVGMEGDFTAFEAADRSELVGLNSYEIIARPFDNSDPSNRGPNAELVAFPNLIVGSVLVEARTKFHSEGLHLICNLVCNSGATGDPELNVRNCDNGFRLDVLGGYRHIHLGEHLRISEESIVSVTPRAGFSSFDEFDARNEFHGGEVGLQGKYRRERWWAEGLFKVAFGHTAEMVFLDGRTDWVLPPAAVGGPGQQQTFPNSGLLVQESNAGAHRESAFAWSPEVGLTLGWKITPKFSSTVGYTFLYLSRVVRVSDLIDTTVNGSYVPDPAASPAIQPNGRARPVFAFQDTTYWAHGLSFGFDYRW